ncbi:MAG: bifunctional 5,10-methylenetetrahydrofolate dehydrogenase/5,10-methenyltetrahydrofolate cyclohydrolase [Candidatus Moranbacteria bacterium]|nr:bifunctional 5,10-methylenetetrahydrofolate dehydrogenase/5,10-methenyltetrahydrofolate cyclohydrolase [Candidatus Moranbacteria bacterium]
MVLLYGKPIAEKILAETRARIAGASAVPGLAVILIGDDASSHLYVGLKEKAAQAIGIHFEKHFFSEKTLCKEIFERIAELNGRDDIHGIIVQLPLPSGFPTDEIIAHIDHKKDTDGFHPETLSRFLLGQYDACPVFPRAVVELLRGTKQTFNGEKGLVVANSELLGKVMAQALTLEGLNSEYVLSSEKKEILLEKIRAARVIVTACGIADFITGEMLLANAIVIDGGIAHKGDIVVGDVERKSVENKIAYLSPVPGGVGPVTVATLLARVADMALN